MRRLVLSALLLPGAALVTLAGPAGPAGAAAGCVVTDGVLTAEAPPGAFFVEVDEDLGDIVVTSVDGEVCSVPNVDISRISVLDNADDTLEDWIVRADTAFGATVVLQNDTADEVAVLGSWLDDQWTNAGGGSLLIKPDDSAPTSDRLRTTVVPRVLRLLLGDGEDVVNLRGTTPWPGDVVIDEEPDSVGDKTIRLGDGDDEVTLGEGDDTVLGFGGRDSVRTGFGDDTVTGGLGSDTIQTEDGVDTVLDPLVETRPDYVDGGPQEDVLDHTGRSRGVWAKVGPHDGVGTVPAYADFVVGVERVVGTSRADRLFGGDTGAELLGGGGDDRLTGGTGNDVLRGGGGADQLRGLDGVQDLLDGGAGRDGATWDAVDLRRSIEYRLR